LKLYRLGLRAQASEDLLDNRSLQDGRVDFLQRARKRSAATANAWASLSKAGRTTLLALA